MSSEHPTSNRFSFTQPQQAALPGRTAFGSTRGTQHDRLRRCVLLLLVLLLLVLRLLALLGLHRLRLLDLRRRCLLLGLLHRRGLLGGARPSRRSAALRAQATLLVRS